MWGQGAFLDHWTPRRILAVALIGFFAARALIPAGFMPDVRALGEGRLELIICTSSGEQIAHSVSLDGNTKDPAKNPLDDCPFHHALAKAIEAADAASVPALYTTADARSVPAALLLTPHVLGPPLGQRAPPHDLA